MHQARLFNLQPGASGEFLQSSHRTSTSTEWWRDLNRSKVPPQKMLLAITQKCMYELCPTFTWLDKIMRRPHWVYKTKLIRYFAAAFFGWICWFVAMKWWSLDDRLVKLKTQAVLHRLALGLARLRGSRRCHFHLIDHRSASAFSFVAVLPHATPYGHSSYLPSSRVPSCSPRILILPAHAHSLRGLRGARRTVQRSGSVKCTHCAARLDFTRPVGVLSQLTGHELCSGLLY